jgi:hypothetical protein
MIRCSRSGLAESTYIPFPEAAQSKVWVCSSLPAEIVGSYLAGNMDVFLFECCVFSDRGLCDQLISRLEESY